MDISIVIPAYNESQKVGRDIEESAAFLKDNNFSGEIIVVDDGSGDDTAEAAKKAGENFLPEIPVKVIRYEENRGKGFAIRTGVKDSRGDFVLFVDSGCCVPFQDSLEGIKILQDLSNGIDIVHGSRKLRKSRIIECQNPYRRMCSWFFHQFAVLWMEIPAVLSDTQCGFKIYRGDIGRELFGKCVSDGFMFDVEIILRAIEYGYKIEEFGIEWRCDRDSRLHPTRSVWGILSELFKIKKIMARERKNRT
jgi:dolichyl-phosphate beta-glucosyltransferase